MSKLLVGTSDYGSDWSARKEGSAERRREEGGREGRRVRCLKRGMARVGRQTDRQND